MFQNPNSLKFHITDYKHRIKTKLKNIVKCSGNRFWKSLTSFIPILDWLPKYNWSEWLMGDVIAGLTIAIMHIPQGKQIFSDVCQVYL